MRDAVRVLKIMTNGSSLTRTSIEVQGAQRFLSIENTATAAEILFRHLRVECYNN